MVSKRVFSVSLVLVLCAVLLCVGASADSYSVSVGGVTLNSSNPYAKSDDTGNVELSTADDYNIYLDVSAHTLTLQDANICEVDLVYRHAVFTTSSDGLNIVLEGNNIVTGETGNDSSSGIYAMYGQVSITGTGSLTITSEHTAVRSGSGKDITISGDVTVKATSTNSRGIDSAGSILISNGAIVTAVAEGGPNSPAVQSSGSITVTGSTLSAESGSENAYGISAESLSITDSNVKSICTHNRGIYVIGRIDIAGDSDVYAKGGGDVGMGAGTQVSITGGKVTVVSESSHGIYSLGGIKISASAIVDASTNAAGGYTGLFAMGDVSIESGTVKAASTGSYGIYSYNGLITVSGESNVSISGAALALGSGIKLSPEANRQFAVLGGTDENTAEELDASPVTEETILDNEQIFTPYLHIESQLVPVAVPVLTESSSFYGSMQVEISCATEGADVYYTTDGSEPSVNSERYAGPFSIDETTTVKP